MVTMKEFANPRKFAVRMTWPGAVVIETHTAERPTLTFLQETVDGPYESLAAWDHIMPDRESTLAFYANEEGRLRDLPITLEPAPPYDCIRGTIIVVAFDRTGESTWLTFDEAMIAASRLLR
jgi:hypothetical protein